MRKMNSFHFKTNVKEQSLTVINCFASVTTEFKANVRA